MESIEHMLLNLLFTSLGSSDYMTESPKKTEYHSKHYQLIIGIGRDHTATLTIDQDSLKKLCDMTGKNIEDLIEGNFNKED